MDMCRFLGGKHVHSDSFLCRDMWRAPFGLHLGKVRPSRTFPLSDAARHAVFPGGCVKMQILTRTRRCVRMAKMQGAEAEGAGSVLKYMTKPECR